MRSFTGQKDRGYPRNAQADNSPIRFVGGTCYGGGKGGGGCAQLTGQQFSYFYFPVPKFLVHNRSLTIRNKYFDVFADAGAGGGCDHTEGAVQPWYLGFGVDDTLTYDDIVAQNIPISAQESPYDIEVPESKLPQPTDAGWDNKIYVYIAWGGTTLVVDMGTAFNTMDYYFDIIKHDYDIKI